MAFDYTTKLKSEGQSSVMTCWAASFTWWLNAMSLADKRRGTDQTSLIGYFAMKQLPWASDGDGGIPSIEVLKKMAGDEKLKMKILELSSTEFNKYSGVTSPMIVVYTYPKIGGQHVNVIFDQNDDGFMTMEPYWPFPGDDGKRTGKYERRSLSHFSSGGKVWVGYAE